MGKCKHLQVEGFNHIAGWGNIAVRCVECHAVMAANAKGEDFNRRHRYNPIPLERKFWKPWRDTRPDPMSYESRMSAYQNTHMVRR
jgi:hypothetical protein